MGAWLCLLLREQAVVCCIVFCPSSSNLTSKSSPCTNVPIHCPICPTSISKASQTIWKYNTLFHLASEHATNSGIPPKIPRQLLANMFITREEEKALKVTEDATDAWRVEHDIPGTDSLLELI